MRNQGLLGAVMDGFGCERSSLAVVVRFKNNHRKTEEIQFVGVLFVVGFPTIA